jgi:methyl-accepting chemotaxis protein
MKKKLIQILMLLVVAVSIGAFVSCKDTNEDLYNELRNQTGDSDMTLDQRLEALAKRIEDVRCKCGEAGGLMEKVGEIETALGMGGGGAGGGGGATGSLLDRMQELEDLINSLGLGDSGAGGDGSGNGIGDAIISWGNDGSGGGNTGQTTLQLLFGDIEWLMQNNGNIASILQQHGDDITTLLAFKTTLETKFGESLKELEDLQAYVATLKSCGCDWDKVLDIEERLKTVESKLATALEDIKTAQATADAAKQIADAATTAATNAASKASEAYDKAIAAGLAAEEAKQYAAKVDTTARQALEKALSAIQIAAELQTLVQNNSNAIEGLKNDIKTIQTTLSQYGAQIGLNTTKIKENADAIAKNVEDIAKNAKAIADLKTTVNDMQTQITLIGGQAKEALDKAIEANSKADVNKQHIDDLKTIVDALKPVVEKNKTDIENLTKTVNNLSSQVSTNTTNITNLTNQFNNYVTEMGTKFNELFDKVNKLEVDLAQVKADCAANLATAKAYADQQIAIAKSEIIAEILDKLKEYYTKEEIDAMIKDLNVSINGNTLKIGEIETTVGENTTRIQAIEDILKDLKGCTCDEQALKDAIELIKKQIAEMWGQVDDNTENIGKNADAIDAINKAIEDLINKTIKDMQENIETLNGDVEDLAVKQSTLELIVNKIKKEYITQKEVKDITDAIIAKAVADSTDFKNRMDVIGDSIANVLGDLVSLTARVEVLENSNFATKDDIANFATKDELAAVQDALSSRITSNSNKITKLNEAVKKIKDDISDLNDHVSTIDEEIEALTNRMDKAEEKLDKIMEEMEDIKSDIATIQNYLAKQVTSITIQGTYNPMFGSFSLPTGTQSNILLAYYGLPAADVEFPTSLTGKYVRPSEALTEKDMEMLGLSGDAVFTWPANMPMMFDKGYAGKIWMTINPNTADVSGLQPTIVNSKDEESLITLRPIQPSEEKLQFGWTRADQSSNGFYEAEAYVTPTDVQKVNAPSFNTSAMMDAAKNVRDALTEMVKNQSTTGNGNMPRLEKLASDVNTIVQGLRFDRSALKVSYTSEDGEGNQTEHSVYSQYNLAATAFQPLNLGTAKDFNFQTIPGYEKAFNLLDRLSGRLNKQVHTFFYDFKNSALVEKVANLTIKDIVVKDLSDDLLAQFILHMDTTFVMDGLSYHLVMPMDVNVPVKFEKDLKIPVHIDDLDVSVPVKWNDKVSIDLSQVSVTTPTVVVKGTATGSPTEVTNSDGKPVTVLVLPVKDGSGNITGYQEVPLENFQVTVDIEASNQGGNAGEKIYLNGQAFANIVIDKTFTGKVDIDDEVEYHLSIEDTFTTTVNIDKWFYFGDNGTDKKSFNLKFNYDMRKAAKDLWGEAQGALNDVNTMLDDIRDIVKEVNNLINKINNYENKITGTVDDIVTRAKSYIDKINSVIVNLVNSTNERFQPFMVASTNKGMKFLSGSKNYPTKLTKDIKLFATSQTMELIVPMARKHVAVTNVFKGDASAQNGNSDCKSKLTAANSGEKMNVVLDGNERVIELNGLASGYVYEIAFSALDFQGKIATRKYYVTVE